jgi:hypothetical protein
MAGKVLLVSCRVYPSTVVDGYVGVGEGRSGEWPLPWERCVYVKNG